MRLFPRAAGLCVPAIANTRFWADAPLMRPPRSLAFAILLTGCAPAGPDPARPASEPGPSAQELQVLMGVMALATADGATVAGPRVTRHQCQPTGTRNRFRCCYVDERGRRATALVQRLPEGELEFGLRWAWITGAPHCSSRY